MMPSLKMVLHSTASEQSVLHHGWIAAMVRSKALGLCTTSTCMVGLVALHQVAFVFEKL